MTPYVAIVGYHLNPWTCGVAKWNARLAQELAIPHQRWSPASAQIGRVLLSIKCQEWSSDDRGPLLVWSQTHRYDLLLHDWALWAEGLARRAGQCFAANRAIHRSLLAPSRLLFCPSTLLTPPPRPPAGIHLFTFGMAHKIAVGRYASLIALLGAQSYQLQVSLAWHQDRLEARDLLMLEEQFRQLVGSRLVFLGYTSDELVHHALRRATACLAFFAEGARANNTTVWAAMLRGVPVITNLDGDSPPEWRHGRTILNLDRLKRWPSAYTLRQIGRAGRHLARQHDWPQVLEALCANSSSVGNDLPTMSRPTSSLNSATIIKGP